MIKIGDRVKRVVDNGVTIPGEKRVPLEGTVVYIHPKGRFYTVEFAFQRMWETRKFRQSYPLSCAIPGEL